MNTEYDNPHRADTVVQPRPLPFHDNAIYWVIPAQYVEHLAGYAVLRTAPDAEWARRRVDEELDHAVRAAAQEQGWTFYHTEQEEQNDDQAYVLRIRRTIYECPQYHKIKCYSVPRPIMELCIMPEKPHSTPLNEPVPSPIALPVRCLMFRGDRAYGAFYDGVLHVVLVRADMSDANAPHPV